MNGKCSLNYKDYTPVTWCIEHETPIGSYEDTRNILKCLNSEPFITVDKRRRSWMFGDIEVSLDDVKNLGHYIELEYKGKVSSPEDIRKKLFDCMELIVAKVGDVEHYGYPWLLYLRNTAA